MTDPHPRPQSPLLAEEGWDLFAAAIEGAREAMTITDMRQPDDPIVYANAAFLALTGYSRDEVIGRNCRFLQGTGTDPAEVARVAAAIAAGEGVSADLLNYRKDGSTFWNALALSPVRDPQGRLSGFFGIQHDVTARKEAELALARRHQGLEAAIGEQTRDMDLALQQKTALLHEVDHRVKNNLQLISSLMLLQSRRIDDERARAALRGMLERVNAVATVHRRLFRSEDIERFDVAQFVRDLVADLMASTGRDDLRAELDLERVDVASAQAAPVALVINELVGNALKHAFPAGRAGVIEISIRALGDRFEISVRDDGVGLAQPHAEGFGLTIANLLCRQLRAELRLEGLQPGVRGLVSVGKNAAH